MNILGLSGPGHDLCFCLVKDGEIKVSIEEERISREKHGLGIHSKLGHGKNYCLNALNLKEEDLDCIVTNDLTYSGFLKMLFKEDVTIINHHLAHAASAYYVSGFEESAVLVVDASGSVDGDRKEVTSFGYASKGDINLTKKYYGSVWHLNDYTDRRIGRNDEIVTNSLGDFYKLFTFLCGFGFLEEGKLMGLAPYGKDTYVKKIWNYIDILEDGEIKIELNKKEFFDFYRELTENRTGDELFRIQADLAYAAQDILEECIIQLLNKLYQEVKTDKLCFAGGVALNSVLNGKIVARTPFREIYVQPAANDAGTAIGAAMYGYYKLMGNPYKHDFVMKTAYTGCEYQEKAILDALEKNQSRLEWKRLSDEEIVKVAANRISEGAIIGWFQGRSEIGPRALGNRSILADPRRKDMKDIINHRVKFREGFRPFAPSVLLEYSKEYFEMDENESPFMLLVYKVREDKRDIIPAVTHVDGTARVQTVTKENGRYHDLIQEFNNITQVPVILNTSFNTKGQPIVETPEDAIQCFLNCDLDDLFIGNYKVRKMEEQKSEGV